MKRYFNLLTALLCCAGISLTTSCSDKDDNNDGPVGGGNPIESVTAVDGTKTATATISESEKTIDFGTFQELIDISNVSVTFKLAKNVVMKTPAKTTASVNLLKPFTVVVNDGKKDISYTMTAKGRDIPDPIISAKVGSDNATIDGRNITIAYKAGMDINAVVLDLTLESGATIKSPTNKTFDLEFGDEPLVVSFMETDYTYTVKLSGYTDPLLALGWTNETANFGTLPKYIRIYKTVKSAGRDNNVAYIAVMGKQATMGVVGDGKDALKTIEEFEQDGAYNVYLVGVNSTLVQTIIRDSKFVQTGTLRSVGTIGQAKDGTSKIAYAQAFDGKLYTFPFRTGESAYVAREVKDGTLWEPRVAVSGAPMILWGGNVLTDKQIICNEQEALWSAAPDATNNARAAIGITEKGKIFAFCGQQVEGSVGTTMKETAQIMKDLGCTSAFSFEGSSSPNLHVNKQKTVINSKESSLKAVQCALVFK